MKAGVMDCSYGQSEQDWLNSLPDGKHSFDLDRHCFDSTAGGHSRGIVCVVVNHSQSPAILDDEAE